MWFRGTKYGVAIYYVCWGDPGKGLNVDAYKTLNGLAKWFARPAYQEVPVQRVGKLVINEKGIEEKDAWLTRKEFIKWAKNLVPFHLPEV